MWRRTGMFHWLVTAFALALLAPVHGADAPGARGAKAPAASQQDPAGFPLPAGLKRKSSSREESAQRQTEIATYTSSVSSAELAKAFIARLGQEGWKQQSRSDSGSGPTLLTIIEWAKSPREAEVRFYAEKDGTSSARVRVFTYADRPAAPASGAAAPGGVTDAGPAAAPPGKVDSAKTAALSRQTGAAPLGPPPTSFKVASFNPAAHQLSWTGTNVANYDLFRVDRNGRTQVLDKAASTGMIDYAFLAPNTTYRLVARHPDGSEGSLDYNYADPPQPKTVANFKAVQSAPGRIKVTWDSPDQYSYSYQVFGPTLPADGLKVSEKSLELTNVPVGRHEVRVAILYGTSEKLLKAPVEAKALVEVLTDRGRYRITVLGAECVHETDDDPLQLDGKRDEVYVGAYIATAPRDNGNRRPTPVATIRTKVMGDTNGFPDRIRAGTASDKGGIQTGDFVPSSAIIAPQPGVAGTSDRFPLLLWEGELLDSSDFLLASAIVFEWDDPDQSAWNQWAGWWSTPNGSVQLGDAARKAPADALFARLSLDWYAPKNSDGYAYPKAYGPDYNVKKNRPVGVKDQAYVETGFVQPDLVWPPTGMVITRAKLEKELGGKDAVVIKWNRGDYVGAGDNPELVGQYALYVQIERLKSDAPPPPPPPAPAASPAPSGPLGRGVASAPPGQAGAARAAEISKQTGAAPIGPAPTLVRVDSNGPVIHKIGWSVTWSQNLTWRSFDVSRFDSHGTTAVVTALPGDPNKSRYEVIDRGYLEPDTKYLIEVHYSDGSVGSAEYAYAKPPNPAAPAGFRAVQSDADEVTLSWAKTDYVAGYQIYGSSLPPEGRYVDGAATTSAKVAGLQLGHVDFQVAVVYTGEGKPYPAPNRATASAELHRLTDRYRVVCLGLECAHETADDLLQLDGKHDEVFMGAYLAKVPRGGYANATPTPLGTRRTKVMGDVNGFPDRLQAGTASDKGGIQTGDFVPSSAVTAAQPGVTGTTDRFPLLLWEGELSDDSDYVMIAPVLFEWDKAAEAPWTAWTDWWSSPQGKKDLCSLAPTQYIDKRWDTILASTWDVAIDKYNSYQRYRGVEYTESGQNRPIGVEDQANMQGSGMVPAPVYVPRGIVLDHRRVEEKLGNASTVMVKWLCMDNPHAGSARLDGNYVLYIQIERLSPPAAKRVGPGR